MNTYCYEIYHILLEIVWQALSNTSSIMRICSAVHEILADKAFTATDDLISQEWLKGFTRLNLHWKVLINSFTKI